MANAEHETGWVDLHFEPEDHWTSGGLYVHGVEIDSKVILANEEFDIATGIVREDGWVQFFGDSPTLPIGACSQGDEARKWSVRARGPGSCRPFTAVLDRVQRPPPSLPVEVPVNILSQTRVPWEITARKQKEGPDSRLSPGTNNILVFEPGICYLRFGF